MGRNSLVLLVLFSVTVSFISAVSVRNQLSASNTESTVLPLPQSTSAASRYLRAVKTNEKNERTAEAEERAVPNGFFATLDDAGRAFAAKLHGSSILKSLDRLSTKLRYTYWKLIGKTPGDVAKILGLGLQHTPQTWSHPNYKKWIGYLDYLNK
ncbi:hypothetical protein DVH05_027107 [Phytophthora capsici]|nr:hypothetical protein DVH05_027107 [Phytophthora capsici]